MRNYLQPVVAFDVDDTLLDHQGNAREDVIALLRLLQKFGCEIIVWSNGGGPNEESIPYAKRICRELAIDALVLEKGSLQPDITIDDLDIWTRISEGTLGRVNIRV